MKGIYLPGSRTQSVRSQMDDNCVERCAAEVSLTATLQAGRPRPSVGSELYTTSQNGLHKQRQLF